MRCFFAIATALFLVLATSAGASEQDPHGICSQMLEGDEGDILLSPSTHLFGFIANSDGGAYAWFAVQDRLDYGKSGMDINIHLVGGGSEYIFKLLQDHYGAATFTLSPVGDDGKKFVLGVKGNLVYGVAEGMKSLLEMFEGEGRCPRVVLCDPGLLGGS